MLEINQSLRSSNKMRHFIMNNMGLDKDQNLKFERIKSRILEKKQIFIQNYTIYTTFYNNDY